MDSEAFDAIMVGAGQAGPAAAKALDCGHRAPPFRRHQRLRRLRADEDAGGESARRATRAAWRSWVSNSDEVVHSLLDLMAAQQPVRVITRTTHIHGASG